ncbi:MAG: outer membrane beta-barrel protein [Bacteroidia bacterium]|nr:outer membrane beta-barrel protein [Bacteroidia bacterium]MCZ2278470.1 outer membrane beta-barrel protein [Bacteroidia bacterium]
MKRTITKIFMAGALAFGMVSGAFAQSGRFSAGLELALPMGDFADAAGMGFGATLRYEYPLSDNLALTGDAGYLMFGKKSYSIGFGDVESKSSMIPVQVGAKYYFGEVQNGFYAGLLLGIHSISSKVTTPEYTFMNVTIPSTSTSESTTKLSYAPQVGYHLANIDIGARYQMIATEGSTSSYLGIRLAYVFGGN